MFVSREHKPSSLYWIPAKNNGFLFNIWKQSGRTLNDDDSNVENKENYGIQTMMGNVPLKVDPEASKLLIVWKTQQ